MEKGHIMSVKAGRQQQSHIISTFIPAVQAAPSAGKNERRFSSSTYTKFKPASYMLSTVSTVRVSPNLMRSFSQSQKDFIYPQGAM